MVVRLRLQRFGRTHSPFYRMVAADARAPRDGKFLEIVSTTGETSLCWCSASLKTHSLFNIISRPLAPQNINNIISGRNVQSHRQPGGH